jgi:hypothetical protein
MVRIIRVLPDELDDAPAAGVLLGAGALDELELDELAQAVRASTAAARLAAIKCLRMGRSSSPCLSPVGDHVIDNSFVHLGVRGARDQRKGPQAPAGGGEDGNRDFRRDFRRDGDQRRLARARGREVRTAPGSAHAARRSR